MAVYLPLHIHSDFSNGDALLDVDDYVKWAKENGYPSIAITDHGNLCASLYFNQVASKAGIKSVIGLEAYCAYKKEFESEDKTEKKERDHCVLIAKNYQGYLDLCWLLGQAMRNTFYYKPIILYEELFKYNKNLIVSSACMGGRIPKLVLENKIDEAIEFINVMKSTFKEDFYLEVMEIQMPDQTAFNQWVINNYKRLGVKVIWTTDTHYLKPEHAEVHDVMKLINTKTSFSDENWKKRVYSSRNLWLKKREDIVEEAISLGYDVSLVNEFLDNTLEIDSKIEKMKLTRAPEVIMPKFADDSYAILEKKTFDALKAKGWDNRPSYVDRIKEELKVIKYKRMEDYFLIVADIVEFSERSDCLVGAGRGCFLPGSKIIVKNESEQFKEIQQIDDHEEVISAQGNYKPVLERLRYDVENVKIVKIKLENGDTLGEGCTCDHGVLIVRNCDCPSYQNTFFEHAFFVSEGDWLFNVKTKSFVRVIGKEEFVYTGPVFDLNVEDDHSYNINGYAVHNSGAGSLVVHLLGITKIDPIKYDLYFERFLNLKRLDPPDIDLDFDSKGRYKVEIYLKEKYGHHAVSHVISFGTFGIKNAIRDTFRVYFDGDKKDMIDKLSKCLENDEDNFDEAIKKMIALEGKAAEDFINEHKKQYDIARVLVGKNRHYSMHAGGVIIAPDYLEKFIPIMRINDQIATGYPEGGDTRLMTDAGLMKFDLLGLNACTIINDTLRHLIGKVTLERIIENDNDKKVLEQFTQGNTFSVFQFEGKHITKFMKRVKPTKFTDLVAANALYRPAVIQAGGLELYIKNKLTYNEEEYDKDPFLKILKETYGIIVYQEQTMQVFQQLGGFTLAEADETRHIFKLLFKGKTDYSEFNHVMEKFKQGCHKTTNYDDKKIEEIMELMKQFSKYCFNKCISGSSKIAVFKRIPKKSKSIFAHEICHVTIEELYKDSSMYSGICLYNFEDGFSERVQIKDVVKTGLKETFELFVIDENVKNSIRASVDHRFFSIEGWKTLNQLKVGDQVLVKGSKGWIYVSITEIVKYGLEETYDIHVDHPDHNYIANSFVVHNSHSCAYAMMAYIMMYLRTYYPTQYFSSLLSNTDNTEAMQDGKRINMFQMYVTEIQKNFNVKIVKPDVNESGANSFRIKDENTLVFALDHIKDVGDKAAQNIEQNQPYSSFKEFLSKVTRRIVNKRVIKALVYSEAIKFDDTAELFKKEIGEEIDTTDFLQRQFNYTSLVASKDLKEAVTKEYSLKAIEAAAAQGKYINKRNAITVIVFVSKFRRLAGISKNTNRPYVMYFATLYDGTAQIDDCILNGAEELNIEEGDLVNGKLHFEEARNKKYSEHTFYLSEIKKIPTTEKYDALSKFNIKTEKKEDVIEEPKRLIRRKQQNETQEIKNIVVDTPKKMINRKKK